MFTRKNSMNLLSRFFTVSIAILVFVLFCKYCSEAVIVVSMSLFFATILNKLTVNIEKFTKLPRAIIAVVLVFGLFATMLYLMYIMLPLMFGKIMTIVNGIYNGGGKFQKLLLDISNKDLKVFGYDVPDQIEKMLAPIMQYSIEMLKSFTSQSLQFSFKIITITGILFLTPVMTFFLLKDMPYFKKNFLDIIPKKYRQDVETLMKLISENIANYVYGQLLVACFLTAFYGFGLMMVKVDTPFVIGAIIGFGSFIPYIGFYCGTLVAMLVTYEQYHNMQNLITVFAILIIGQIIEGNFITPKIIGDKIGVHPIWVIISVLVFIPIFGFAGAVFALPMTGIIGEIASFLLIKYKNSSYYKG